jgi:hypothetical protein
VLVGIEAAIEQYEIGQINFRASTVQFATIKPFHDFIGIEYMLISPVAAQRFMAGYKTLLLHVHAEFRLKKGSSVIAELAAARGYLTEHPQNLSVALAALEADQRGIEDDIATAIRSMRVDQWVYLRHTTRYAVFIDQEMTTARAVRALTDPIAAITGQPAVTFKAGIFEFDGCYVCDGIIETPVYLGSGYRASYNAGYTQLRKTGKFLVAPAC